MKIQGDIGNNIILGHEDKAKYGGVIDKNINSTIKDTSFNLKDNLSEGNIEKSRYLDFVESRFSKCFEDKGYIEEKPVNITSKCDDTVDFIGSSISPLKKYLSSGLELGNGRFLIQPSMKLKYLKILKKDVPQKFGCYYKSMGIIAKPELNKVVYDTFDYLMNPNYLGISPEDICIKINGLDTDLMESVGLVPQKVIRRINTLDNKHYVHKYGIDGIYGRDFNIGIRKKDTDDFFSCAAFVVMEDGQNKIAIDMGFSNLSLSMCKFGTSSTIASSRMADLIKIDSLEKEKFADSLIGISILLKEKIMQHNSKNFRRKFRIFFHALNYWNEKFNYTNEEITRFIVQYLSIEFHQDFSNNYDYYKQIVDLYNRP